MTNPNDAVGTNAAYDGRTSVNAFNDDLAAYTSGILSGWACTPNSGLTVSLGGDGSTRDVAVAEDNAGNKTSINNISGSPIDVTMSAAPGSNSRIDLVVAYVDNPPQGVNTTADNPSACGIIKVTGTASSTPVAPNDTAIRTAITGDGASGATAYYAILAVITIPSGTTDITTSNIQAGPSAITTNVDFSLTGGNYSTTEQDTGFTWIDGKHIYKKTYNVGPLPNNTTKNVPHGLTSLDKIIKWEGASTNTTGNTILLPSPANALFTIVVNTTNISIYTTSDRTGYTYAYITLYYTKTN